jgi:hypothetical protein
VGDFLNVFANREALGLDGTRYAFREDRWKKVSAAGEPLEEGGPRTEEEKEEARRKVLWDALRKALPKELADIDAYGENPSLTEVCFSSRGKVFFFALKDKKVEELHFMVALSKVNRITFEVDEAQEKNAPGRGRFVLWRNGKVEMRFPGSK